MPQYWTDELSDRIARDRPSVSTQAGGITWACLTLGPLIAALIVAAVLRVWR